jgi:hypothetical protein
LTGTIEQTGRERQVSVSFLEDAVELKSEQDLGAEDQKPGLVERGLDLFSEVRRLRAPSRRAAASMEGRDMALLLVAIS